MLITALTNGTGDTSSDGDSATTASFTPLAKRSLIVIVGAEATAGADMRTPSLTGNGLSYTLRGSENETGVRALFMFTAPTGDNPSAGTLLIDFGAGTDLIGFHWSVLEVTGLNFGTPIGTVVGSSGTSETTATTTLSYADVINGAGVFATLVNLNIGFSIYTPESGWTQVTFNTNHATPATSMAIMYRQNTADTTPSISWTPAANWRAISADLISDEDTPTMGYRSMIACVG